MLKTNNKGFTLVELLIVIVLMISILVLAIVSFTNISEGKRSESWSYVKEQIETAAEEYLTSNEYLFEGFNENENASGTVSLGKLVSLGYLNTVTDPRTGDALSKCTIIKITKNNGVLTASLDETTIDSNKEQCDKDSTINSTIVIKEEKAPTGNITFYKDANCTDEVSPSSETGWFNIDSLGEDKPLYALITTDGSVSSITVKVGGKEVEGSYCVKLEDEGENEVTATLTGTNGKSSTSSKTYKKDTIYPIYHSTVVYKMYNIDGSVLNDGTCTGNTALNKNGVTCFNNSTNTDATVEWNVDNITDSKYKITGITGMQIAFPKDQLSTSVKINYQLTYGSSKTTTSPISVNSTCTSSGSTIYTCTFDEAYTDITRVKVIFMGQNQDFLNKLDGSGIQLYVKNEDISNTGEIKLYNNYKNFIRTRATITDEASGYNKMEICSTTKNKCETMTYLNNSFISEVSNSTLKSGDYYLQDSYVIHVSDVAGNVTDVTMSTKGKFD